MNEATKKLAMALAVVTIAGCGTMSHRDRDTVVGAGVGAAAGAAITGDVGGVIGNQVGRH
jgi:osmotically inducible lipoprotein OsmB